MTVQHQNFRDLATRLIAKNGRPVVLVERASTGVSYDPGHSEKKTGVMAVQVEFNMHEVRGDLVRDDDKKFLIDGVVPIDPSMRLRDYEEAAHDLIPMGAFTGNPIGLQEESLLIAEYSIVNPPRTQPGRTVTHHEVFARL